MVTLNKLGILALALLSAGLIADPITIKDWTGRGFAPDLVNYKIKMPENGGKTIRVIDADGRSLPVQITPAAKGQATLSFVAEVAPGGTAKYELRNGGPAAKPAVTVSKEGGALILSNQMLAVKLPAPMENAYDQPVAANTLPAPITAFRGTDGNWRGAASILTKRAVKKLSIKQTANGPVFVETLYRLDYAEGGYWEVRVRVTDRAPFAKVTEEYDLAGPKNQHYWQLDISKGWNADAAEHMFVAGQGYGPVKYPTLAKEEKTRASGPSVGAEFPGGGGAPTRCIHHDSCWGSRYVSYYGIHNADARKANPDNYPLAIVAPLHKGAWRRANSINVYVKNNQATMRFPLDVAPISWKNEPASDVSPFSCHEHDPSLPVSTGRRVWALVLAKPTRLVDGYGKKKTLGIGYAVRDLYGMVGLDRYKDFVLEWPDKKVEYPRVFITPKKADKYRKAVAANPKFPLLPWLKKYYWFTQDDAVAAKEVKEVHKQLHRNVDYIIKALSIHHHHTLAHYGEPIGHAESILSWPKLPAADRKQIRARLALLAYLLVEPDVTSAGNSSHHGNPNMGISRLMDRSNVAALIPDHPMHKQWSEYMASFMAYKTGSFMAPAGAWFEYGASYHMHGYSKILRGMAGVFSDNASPSDLLWNYHRVDFDYYMNLLSPMDPRYGARTIPGMANATTGSGPQFIQSMGLADDRDPAFAAEQYWAWIESGKFVKGADAVTLFAMARPWIKPKAPKLTSRSYPGFGVVFRAHQGQDETCLYLRSGYLWSHWSQDQGNLLLYSKGAVLLPPQPYQYGGPKDKSFPDKNFMRFGAPTNDLPHDWADSNILDTAFGPTVDYAWSSTGYPDWFINPGSRPRWNGPRKLVEGMNQKEGAFTWNRQVMFLKGKTAKSPNYFVIRDTTTGEGRLASWFNLNFLGTKEHVKVNGAKVTVDSEWPTDLNVLFLDRKDPKPEIHENPTRLSPDYNYKLVGKKAGVPISRDWVTQKGQPATAKVNKWGQAKFGGGIERQVQLRVQSKPGQEVAWVLYPRGAGETAPKAKQLAPGVTKVTTSESTDYVFLAPKPLTYKGEGVEFAGLAGAVRVRQNGKVTLVLSGGPGKVGYKGTVVEGAAPFEKTITGKKVETIAKPTWKIDSTQPAISEKGNAIRFVCAERKYVELTKGNVGVRGMGPFDLTFTPNGITGTVDGDIRTIVTTWPENITRPAYSMDGVRWYAGFADEHSIYKGTKAPQFAIAMGVTAGQHKVSIHEWTWPAMPPAPRQRRITVK